MRHIFILIACLATLVLPSAAQDSVRAYKVEDVPNVRLTDTRLYVSDPTGILSPAARDTINVVFSRLEKETGIEASVVMLPSIGEDNAFDFSHRLFRLWGVGKKKSNNGLLILFVADQRSIRFTTGYGLEGVLPDAACKRIQTRYMIPAFSKGDWDTGMTAGAKAVYARLKDSMKPDATPDEGFPVGGLVFLVLAIALMMMMPRLINRRTRKCQYCGKPSLRKMSSDVYRTADGGHVRKDVFVCDNCGRITVKHTRLDDNGGDSTGAFLGGMFLGSMFGRGHGGGFGGGGFSGGSFGGGDSGGGGADSNW